MPRSLRSIASWTARVGLFVGALVAVGPGASDAAPTAALTLNQTEFRAGDTLSVGLQVANPSGDPAANLYLGVVMPDGETALFITPGGTTPPVSLTDPANFRSLQPAPPGFSLNAPVFSQFTWPADGLPPGTYVLFAALTQASNGSLLVLDVKPFTYSPRNVFLPMFVTGYTLRNNLGETYAFPPGTVIRDGQPIRLHSGSGVNGETVLFWGRSQGAWNNLGDCAQLFNPSGGRYSLGVSGGSC